MRRHHRAELLTLLGAALLVAGCSGRQPAAPDPTHEARVATFRRLAIVCGPAPGAAAGYCAAIMPEVRRMAPSRLDFLDRVDVRDDVAVGTGAQPPTVALTTQDYDAAVVLVYAHDGPVVMDMHLIDLRTGAEVWTHHLETVDADISARFGRHGYWTPMMIKREFYGRP